MSVFSIFILIIVFITYAFLTVYLEERRVEKEEKERRSKIMHKRFRND
jgi:hypothetical protein